MKTIKTETNINKNANITYSGKDVYTHYSRYLKVAMWFHRKNELIKRNNNKKHEEVG